MRNAWRFHYALILVIEVVCGNIVLRCSPLKRALAPIGCIDEHFKNSNYKYCVSFFVR
ncbi:TPA: DUF3265 domain-containing protein [Vibrio vulnificus]|nr:DUF3265 domain-containing protein [Vibrio vulnificus]HAT7741697.1 DUF3265 domain-containing protein [Vibrio vulnificus]